jgi:hypothetical protein
MMIFLGALLAHRVSLLLAVAQILRSTMGIGVVLTQ